MGYSFQLARGLRIGEALGQEDKVRSPAKEVVRRNLFIQLGSNLPSEQVSIPSICALIKDHKEIVEGEPVKVRPV